MGSHWWFLSRTVQLQVVFGREDKRTSRERSWEAGKLGQAEACKSLGRWDTPRAEGRHPTTEPPRHPPRILFPLNYP